MGLIALPKRGRTRKVCRIAHPVFLENIGALHRAVGMAASLEQATRSSKLDWTYGQLGSCVMRSRVTGEGHQPQPDEPPVKKELRDKALWRSPA